MDLQATIMSNRSMQTFHGRILANSGSSNGWKKPLTTRNNECHECSGADNSEMKDSVIQITSLRSHRAKESKRVEKLSNSLSWKKLVDQWCIEDCFWIQRSAWQCHVPLRPMHALYQPDIPPNTMAISNQTKHESSRQLLEYSDRVFLRSF